MKVELTLEQIINITGGTLLGSTQYIIKGIQGLEQAQAGDLAFYYNEKYKKYLYESDASVILIPRDTGLMPKSGQAFIETDNPHASLVKILNFINHKHEISGKYIHETAIIDEYAFIPSAIVIEPYVTIGKKSIIGDGSILMTKVTIMDNVTIGKNVIIYPNSIIHSDTVIGDNCIIYSGAVIGSDGFGYLENPDDGTYSKIPQLGNVVLEYDVEVGANTTIDRALIGTTIIKNGTKIDNLVHIAHNCEIGANTAIAAQSGFSGSVKTGQSCKFGGQTGIAGHLEITDNVTLLAQSGVSKSITNAGVYFGSPAKEHVAAFKQEALLRNLQTMYKELAEIKKKLKDLENN